MIPQPCEVPLISPELSLGMAIVSIISFACTCLAMYLFVKEQKRRQQWAADLRELRRSANGGAK